MGQNNRFDKSSQQLKEAEEMIKQGVPISIVLKITGLKRLDLQYLCAKGDCNE